MEVAREDFGTLQFSQIDGAQRVSFDNRQRDLSEDEMAGLIISKAEHEQVFQGISAFDLEQDNDGDSFLDRRKWSEEFKGSNRQSFSHIPPSLSDNEDESFRDSGQEAHEKIAGRRLGKIKLRQHFVYFSDLLKGLVRDTTLVLVCKN